MNERDSLAVLSLRREIVLTGMTGANKAAHLASALSCIEILYTLYRRIGLKYDPLNPKWSGRDRVIMSKGHGALAQYVTLAQCGFFTFDALRSFAQPGSIFGGEPDCNSIPGIEASTGSLGHGLSYGVGLALSYQTDAAANRVYVVLGDGESEEGTIWEAAMTAAKYRLGNLRVVLDCNKLQKMGAVSDIGGVASWVEKWRAFGWDVREADGHDTDALAQALEALDGDKPGIVIAHTIKGKGLSFMEGNAAWHYRIPNRPEMKKLERELGITKEDIERAERVYEGAV